MRTLYVLGCSLLLALSILLFAGNVQEPSKRLKKPRYLQAGKALADWYQQRVYPGNKLNMRSYSEAYEQLKNTSRLATTSFAGTWTPIGPKNFGGRTLSLAFNPQNPNTIWAGAASGGLWRSVSGANGAQAWQQIETGFPILGVASIAVNPLDSNEIYIGTGEVYNDQNAGTGFAIRTTRGSYGIGLLKSTDNGVTWTKSIDWQYDDLKGVQEILINPLRPQTVFAATTEGTFRSFNAGQTWTLINSARMATDLLMMPDDTSLVMIAAGNSFSANPGIYRSVNGGTTFTQIVTGLPATYSGKAMLDVCRDEPDVMYASIANQLDGLGLYTSSDRGLTWLQINPTDYQTYQGWYSHDVSVHPANSANVITCGIDVWSSFDGGANLSQVSYWYNWDFNDTTVGGPEGPPDYVHADIHRLVRHPQNDDILYLATDGGVFRSFDGGATFEGCNGGYQTQQFYANFSNSASDSLFAIGGMQDNATAVYEGNDGWRRVIGGDGLSTAINPNNDQIVYGSSQYLNIEKSTDKAQTFNSVGNINPSQAIFAGPFVLAPTNPNVLYAGSTRVHRTNNGGQTWTATNNGAILDGNPVLSLEVSDVDLNVVYATTAPVTTPQTALWKSIDGGVSWNNVVAGLPNRYLMDVAIDPSNNNRVYVAVGGFGTPHVYKTLNGGTTWSPVSSGLADVPANTITIDPLNTQIVYLGNDLGIFVSVDGGASWQPFNEGLTDATLVMDISISPFNRKLRLATHGKGVYERAMLPVTITGIQEAAEVAVNIFPNPVSNTLHISTDIPGKVAISIYDLKGKLVHHDALMNSKATVDVSSWANGTYLLETGSGNKKKVTKFVKY